MPFANGPLCFFLFLTSPAKLRLTWLYRNSKNHQKRFCYAPLRTIFGRFCVLRTRFFPHTSRGLATALCHHSFIKIVSHPLCFQDSRELQYFRPETWQRWQCLHSHVTSSGQESWCWYIHNQPHLRTDHPARTAQRPYCTSCGPYKQWCVRWR